MSLRVQSFGPAVNPNTRGSAAPMPQGLKDLVANHQKQMQPRVDAAQDQAKTLRAEAQTLRREAISLTGSERDAKLKQANDKEKRAEEVVDKAWGSYYTGVSRISGVQGRDLMLRNQASVKDAGRALPTVSNATLWSVRFGYGTGKSNQAWLTDLPKDGKVTFNVVASPSIHVGNDANPQTYWDNFENFARTNSYVAEIFHRDENGRTTRLKSETFKVKNPPEYATLSPDMTVDVSGLKGSLVIRGWAQGSAGYAGYIEGRETVVHLSK